MHGPPLSASAPPLQARQATAAAATGLGRYGWVGESIRDAVIILQAAGRGLIPHVTCRLVDEWCDVFPL